MRGEARVTLRQAYCISLPRGIAFTQVLFRLRALSAMDGKIQQRDCIKFCVKHRKSTTEILEMLCEAFGEQSLSWTAIF
jgi:hypothetical protein